MAKDDCAGADRPAVGGRRGDPVAARFDIGDFGRGIDPRAALDRGVEEAAGQATRIEGEVVEGEQRRRALDAEAVGERPSVEELRLDAGLAAGLRLGRDSRGVEQVAGKIKVVGPTRIGGDAQRAGPCGQRMERQMRPAPGAFGLHPPDLLRQVDQRRVDLVFDQRRARRRRPHHRTALVDDDDAVAVGQRLGNQRSGNAGADDQHIPLHVADQRAVRDGRHRPALPIGPPGAQVTVFGCHEKSPFEGRQRPKGHFDPSDSC